MLKGDSTQGMPGSDDRKHVFEVHDDPVMRVVVDVMEKLGGMGRLTLRARGRSIPNAVAIANIITEKMMEGTSAVQAIRVDSDDPKVMGRMLSIIEIDLVRKA